MSKETIPCPACDGKTPNHSCACCHGESKVMIRRNQMHCYQISINVRLVIRYEEGYVKIDRQKRVKFLWFWKQWSLSVPLLRIKIIEPDSGDGPILIDPTRTQVGYYTVQLEFCPVNRFNLLERCEKIKADYIASVEQKLSIDKKVLFEIDSLHERHKK